MSHTTSGSLVLVAKVASATCTSRVSNIKQKRTNTASMVITKQCFKYDVILQCRHDGSGLSTHYQMLRTLTAAGRCTTGGALRPLVSKECEGLRLQPPDCGGSEECRRSVHDESGNPVGKGKSYDLRVMCRMGHVLSLERATAATARSTPSSLLREKRTQRSSSGIRSPS